MKKIVAFLVLISSLFAMTACSNAVSNTKVRVIALSYSSENTDLAIKPDTNQIKLLSNKLLADEVEEYIFPGDILTFTIELEDPNFEFISLLSIKFNDQVIRANVDNSIVTTRDCGANICVDFPFEISADKSEYVVQEVKFAKLNSDNGVNAIIDSNTTNQVFIDVYQGEVYPYVLSSLALLNELIAQMEFFTSMELEGAHNEFQEITLIYSWYLIGRSLLIEGYNNDLNQLDTYGVNFGALDLMLNVQYFQYINIQDSNNFNTIALSKDYPSYNKTGAPLYTLVQDKKLLYIGILEARYSNMNAYNIGNTLYLSINDISYEILVFDKMTRLVPLEFEVPVTFVD